jgi:tetratricopeptide (TPR) repeat protein
MSIMKPKIASAAPQQASFWDYFVPPVFLSILSFAFYAPSFRYPFQFDDIANITKRFTIRDFDPFYRFLKIRWMGELLNSWNFMIGRFDPFTYRLINVIAHTLTGLVLFFLLFALLRLYKKNTFIYKHHIFISFITSALFLLHPTQTQLVSYVIQARLEGLATLFTFLMLLVFVLATQAQKTVSKVLYSIALVGIGILACSTKEIVIVIPILALAFDWFFIAQGDVAQLKKRWWLHALVWAAIWGTFLYHETSKWFTNILGMQTTTGNNRGNIITNNADDLITPYHYLISEFKVIVHYLWMFVWPFGISVEYDWKLSDSFFVPDSFFPFLGLALLIAFIGHSIYKRKYDGFCFGMVWFFVAVAPRSSIVPSPELLCDYKTYLASAGWLFVLALGLCFGLERLFELFKTSKTYSSFHKLFLAGVGLILLGYGVCIGFIIYGAPYNYKALASLLLLVPFGLGYLVYYALKHHKNESLYTPSTRALASLILLMPLGYLTYSRNLVWSCPEYFWGDIVKKAPLKARAHNNYGVSISEKGKYEEAIVHYKRAIELDANYADPWSNLAVAYSLTNRNDHAIQALRNAIKIFPDYPEAYNNLGSFLLQKKEYESAERCFKAAIQLRSYYGKAFFNLGRLYLEQDKKDLAWQHFEYATRGDLDNEHGYTILGEVSVKLNRFKDAINAYEKAIKLGANSPQILFNLANAYYMEKEFDKAVGLYHVLIKENPQNPHYHYNLGETYATIGDYNRALEAFNVAKNLPNAVAQTHFRIAYCLEQTKRLAEAKGYLQVMAAADAPDWFKDAAKKELDRVSSLKA